jgi:hypothetical protein
VQVYAKLVDWWHHQQHAIILKYPKRAPEKLNTQHKCLPIALHVAYAAIFDVALVVFLGQIRGQAL